MWPTIWARSRRPGTLALCRLVNGNGVAIIIRQDRKKGRGTRFYFTDLSAGAVLRVSTCAEGDGDELVFFE